MFKKLAEGPDYFAVLGNGVRIAAAVVLAPFALFFAVGALLAPVAAVCIALKGDWNIAGIVLGSGLLYALLAVPLCWIVFRLYRGDKTANGVTILPTWLVRTFLAAFLGPLSIGLAAWMFLQAIHAGMDLDWTLAVIWTGGACGFLASLYRAAHVAFRLGQRGDAEGVPNPALESTINSPTDKLAT